MSLINDVLRDLDRRRGAPGGQVPAGVRVSPRGHRGAGAGRLLFWSVAVVLVAGTGYLVNELLPRTPPQTDATQASRELPIAPEQSSPAVREAGVPALQEVSVRESGEGLELRFLAAGPMVHALERSDDGSAVTLQLPVSGEETQLPDLLRRMPQLSAVDWRIRADHLILDLRFDTPPRLQARRLAAGVALNFDFPADDSAAEGERMDAAAEDEEPSAADTDAIAATDPAGSDAAADSEDSAPRTLVEGPLGIPTAEADSAADGGVVKSPSRDLDAAGALRRGRRAEEAGRIDQAMSIYRDALEDTPDAWRLRRALAASHERRGEHAAAVDVLAAGLQYESGAPELARLKARLLMDSEPERAIRVLEAHPAPVFGGGRWHALLAALYRQTGRAAEAVPLYRELARQQSSEGRWWLGLGVSLDESGEPARARASYQRALAVGGLNSELTAFLRQRIESLE